MTPSSEDQRFMRLAIAQAEAAGARGNVPIGAVVLREGEILAAAGNGRVADGDPVAHAELLAIRAAAAAVGDWRLNDCQLYVTLEPCVMCAGAIVLARVGEVIYGAADPKAGAVESLYHILDDARLNHRPRVRGGVEAERCGALLSEFFRAQRRLGKK